MRNTIWLGSLVFLFACFLTQSAQAAAAKKNEYKPGTGTTVASWSMWPIEAIRTSVAPFCVYVYNSRGPNPENAELMEGPNFIGNADVQNALKTFRFVKLDISFNAKDKAVKAVYESWASVVNQARSVNYALFVFNIDFALQGVFCAASANPQTLKAVLEKVAKYETEKKARLEKQEKANQPKAAEQPKDIEVPGLSDNNKGKSKDGAKKPEGNKPAVPMDE